MTEKFLAEVFGTAVLILLGDGVVAGVLLAKSKAQNSGWIVITWAWGLAVFCGVVVAGPLSGAHLNPAVTLGLAVMEAMKQGSTGITWETVPPYIAGEFIGAMIGAALVSIHYWDHFKATEDKGLKLAVFCTAPNIRNYPLNLISETIGTFVLVFVISAFGQPHSLAPATVGALPVALLIVVIGCRSEARPDTRSTQPATSARASFTRSCRSRARADRTGSIRGCRLSVH
jgi:glycerol uptake facilitator protein